MSWNVGLILCIIFLKYKKERSIIKLSFLIDSFSAGMWGDKSTSVPPLEKYKNGDYTLGLLNVYGQRINIRIELPRKSGNGTVSFITGWMVKPNGLIQLNTPFGGK